MTFPATHISIAIAKPKPDVYHYVSNPEHFPEWLDFVKSISRQSGNNWTAQTSLGEINMDFVQHNDFGVVDDHVTVADGTTLYNPLRVLENGEGSEVVFTLYRMPGKTQEQFDKDADMVKADLKKLKEILEG